MLFSWSIIQYDDNDVDDVDGYDDDDTSAAWDNDDYITVN